MRAGQAVSWLLISTLCFAACAKWSGTCHDDLDCGECERCQNGQCEQDPTALNPCGDCAPTPEEVCYDDRDNDCDDLTDEDCAPCGNGRLDPDETCDGDCPTECTDNDACTGDQLLGRPQDCDVRCEFSPITACQNDDGCCPASCDRHEDSDCNLCGNGQLDPGETCDGDCPVDCDDGSACTQDDMSGTPEDCDVICMHEPILACIHSDGCCPADCTEQTDPDCIRPSWFKTFGGYDNDEFTSLIPDAAGGFLVAGQTESLGQEDVYDIWLLGLDSNGTIIHQDTYGGPGKDYARALLETADGYLLAGNAGTHTTNWSDFRLIKTDPTGEYAWQRTYGSEDEEFGWAVVPTGDLGFTVAGYTYNNWGNSKAMIMHLDADGDLVWKKTYGESGEIYLHLSSLQATPDGGTIAAGAHYEGNWDALVLKLDSNGDLEWKQAYGGGSEETSSAIQVLPDGYLLAGLTNSFGAGDSDIWLVKLDLDGAILWQKAYGADGPDESGDLRIDPAGGFILAGETERAHGFTERQHLWLLRLDPDGTVLWQKTYGGNGDTHAGTVLPLPEGYLVAGSTRAFGAGLNDGFIMKTDPTGHVQGPCPEDFITDTTEEALPTEAIARDPTLILMVTNVTMDSDPLLTTQPEVVPSDLCLE